jgi:hypothetical protein
MRFEKGNKAAKGGKRNPPGGRPTKAALEAQEARLAVWQKELEKNELILARRYVKRAMKSDRVLIDARKATVPDAKQEIQHSGEIGVRPWLVDVDPRLEKKKDESGQ